jgi:S-(hydroxymethyl)glutathione dehydrogenase/alcohol dehydrogenase
MKAVVFHKPGNIQVDNVPEPNLEHPQDIVLRVTSTAICCSDLHILNGLIPQTRPLIMGHEFMGIVEGVGGEVSSLSSKGDRVVVPFPIACGICFFCHHGLPGHCENSNPDKYSPEGGVAKGKGGALFGYTDLYGGYSGGQAEYVRVPYANFGPRRVPADLSDEEVLFLTDILPRRPKMQGQCPVKVVPGQCFKRAQHDFTGVVNQHINPSKTSGDCFDRGPKCSLLSHITDPGRNR